jgi:alpha-L-fucosidase
MRWYRQVVSENSSAFNILIIKFLARRDRYNPKTLQKHKWENAFTLDKISWGLRRDARADHYLSIHEVIQTVAESIRF